MSEEKPAVPIRPAECSNAVRNKTSDGKCPDSGTYGSSLDAARAAVASAKEALVALESEARRSGALAAWTR